MSNIIEQYRITQQPYYRAVADEVNVGALTVATVATSSARWEGQ